jgi:AbrB family looped-hinge helix DNA binding protein
MTTATISSKFQIAVPKEAREKLHLKSGQKMAVVVKGSGLHYIPVPSLEDLKGFLKGMNTDDLRDESDR